MHKNSVLDYTSIKWEIQNILHVLFIKSTKITPKNMMAYKQYKPTYITNLISLHNFDTLLYHIKNTYHTLIPDLEVTSNNN